MEESFWQDRWREGRIGFHEARPNRLLEAHFASLGLTAGDTVLVPLCGKSVDLDWLLAQGLKVIGAEFNQGAVEEVFDRLQLQPEVSQVGALKRYAQGDLTVFCGDFFAVTQAMLGPVTAVYDRAALVAIAPQDRVRYAGHLAQVTDNARQLVITFDYDQSAMQGPPFSINADLVKDLYGAVYECDVLESSKLTGPMAERSKGAVEEAWLLHAR